MVDLAMRHRKAPAIAVAAARGLACLALLTAGVSAQTAQPAAANKPAYFEFGTVVSVGPRSIVVSTLDPQKQKPVQHSFPLPTDSRSDVVRAGDNVEVIFSADVDWTIRRLILLNTPIPKPGPPPGDRREVPEAIGIHVVPTTGSAGKVPAAASVNGGARSDGKASAASAHDIAIASGGGKATSVAARNVAVVPGATGTAKAPAAGNPIEIAGSGKAKFASVLDVPVGSPEAATPKLAKATDIVREVPLEECNRSSAEWPTQPLRLAVLDFRYPTEREESHDIGTTGGGSGTAVADLVFSSLDELNQFAMSRGDRTRLFRADFAGAARVGRELGVDAVLAGTFAPVDPPPGSDPDFPPPKSYELRAGVVDTCTGQLLLRLTSVTCTGGADPNQSANAASCKRFAVTAKQASDPKDQGRAFKQPIDALLNPLVHNGPPPGTQGTAGVVASAVNGTVTIRLPSGSAVKAGDQVALHAWRLTKNPTTYTLHNLHDEEIGRVTVSAVQGGVATGAYAGDFPPQPGDTAEVVAP